MAHKNKVEVALDLSVLPQKANHIIDWDRSIDIAIPFNCEDIHGYIYIIDMYYCTKRKQRRFLIQYHGKQKWIYYPDFVRGHFVRFIRSPQIIEYNGKQYFPKYQIGEIINYCYKKDGPISSYKTIDINIKYSDNFQSNMVFYTLQCLKCGAIIERIDSQINGCPCCNNQAVFPGINDITTTDPWMIDFFPGGNEEAKKYVACSTKRIHPKCPICGKVSNATISLHNLKRIKHIKCSYCSDGISYPERFMLAFLNQNTSYNFIYQAGTKDVGFDCEGKIYDFYFPDLSLIIETHGMQHYENNGFHNSLEQIQANDRKKQELAIKNGIKHYIIINCSDTSLDALMFEILSSDLPSICDINIQDINWGHCVDQAISNLTKMICEDYNDGYSFQDLKHKYHLGCKSIRNAIKRGEEIGWCIYIADIDKYAPIDVYYHDNYIFSGICASDVANTLQQKYHIKATKNMINGRIRNGADLNGYSFIRIKNSKRAREVICNAG